MKVDDTQGFGMDGWDWDFGMIGIVWLRVSQRGVAGEQEADAAPKMWRPNWLHMSGGSSVGIKTSKPEQNPGQTRIKKVTGQLSL